MTKQYLLLLFVTISSFLSAQNTYSISGTITDTSGVPLLASTIMLMAMDTTFEEFSRTDGEGRFEFKKVERGNHLLRATFMGSIPVTLNVSYDGSDIDVGTIEMKEISTELMEVVIKAARAPIKLRGDTIEYDASTFRVPEGSSVEDLLKRLPGIEVDQNGNISSDGNSVSKVTVDGKEFFGSDPKAATKNLPAEGISKVQVFDNKTEEEEITGVEDNSNQNKTMNLELKDDFKKGAFGKVTAGVGTEDRAELKGNYNRFNDKIQFSLIGVANNTGRNGLSWDDYQGFMGSESWSFDDEGVYGFGNGGFRSFSYGGDEDGLESSLQDVFFSGRQTGLPSTINGGVNFNYDHNKTKLNSYYFINQKKLQINRTSEKETFLDPFNARESSNSISETEALGHRGELEWKQEIDSFNTVKLNLQFAAVDNEGNKDASTASKFENDNFNTSQNTFNNKNLTDGYLWNGRILYSKKFRSNKRRRFGVNASLKSSTLNAFQGQNSINNFYDMAGQTAQEFINQDYDNVATKDEKKINGIYVQPLGAKFALQTFYNYSNRQEEGDRQVVDIQNNEEVLNSFLTRNYVNDISLNRIGTSLKYAHKGFNLSLGTAFQKFVLQGEYAGVTNSGIEGKVDKVFQNWIPNISTFFQPFRNSYFNLSYNVNAREPSIRNLQPVVDNSNPFYLREGNPELIPEINHNLGMYFSLSKPLSGFRVYTNANHTFYDNQIITEETINERLVTSVKPINYDGGNSTNFSLGMNVPIKTNKISVNMRVWSNIRNSNAFVNNVLNSTKSTSITPSLRLSITPGDKFALYLSSSFENGNANYNVNESLNQKTKNFRYGIELNSELVLGVKVNTTFNLSHYENDRLDLNQDIPIWNISIYRQFLKGNKAELRLSLYDAFNKNVAISQYSSNYSIVRSNTVTLARYGMISFTYNIQGIKSDIKGRRR